MTWLDMRVVHLLTKNKSAQPIVFAGPSYQSSQCCVSTSKFAFFCVFLAALFVASSSLFIPQAYASSESQESNRILVAPPARILAHVLQDPDEPYTDLLHESVRKVLGSEQSFFSLIDEAELHQALNEAPLYENILALAEQWSAIGMESYRRLDGADAISHFEKALQNYTKIHYDVVDPEAVTDVLFYLSLAYIEDNSDIVRPLDLLKWMIRLNGTRAMLPGYYPDSIVQFYRSAQDALIRDYRDNGPPVREASELASAIETDWVLYAYILPTFDGTQFELMISLYSTEQDAFERTQRYPLIDLDAGAIHNTTSDLIARFIDSLQTPENEPLQAIVGSQGTSPLAIHVSFAYGSFLKFPSPIQSAFGNYGIALGVTYLLTREFGFIANLQVLNSMRDYNGILREDFSTLRSFWGTHLGLDLWHFNLALQTSLEITSLGPIRAYGDKNCIAAPDLLCPNDRGVVTLEQQGLLVGMNARPRISLRLHPSMELAASVSMTYFFLPSAERLLNFPLTTEFGLQYRF